MSKKEVKDLLKGCRQGKRSAQRLLYEKYKGMLFPICLRYADNRVDAEDILQEGFITIFKDLHKYEGKGSWEGWMKKVVLRVALNYIRKRKKLYLRVNLDEVRDQTDEVLPVELKERAGTLVKLMQKLPVGYRTILNLYVIEGYTHEAIARELNISIGTSKSQLNRAKAKMRALLEKRLIC